MHLLVELSIWSVALCSPSLQLLRKVIVTLLLLSYHVIIECVKDACQALVPTMF